MPVAHLSKLTQQHPARDTNPEVPRHQAWQSQLAALCTANGVATHLLHTASLVPRVARPTAHPSGRGANHQVLRASWQAGKIVQRPICLLAPGKHAGELCPGSLGCQPAWSSKASGVLSPLFLLSITPHELVPVKNTLNRGSR